MKQIRNMGNVLQDLRANTPMQYVADLKQERIWFDWAAKQEKVDAAREKFTGYSAIATGHWLRFMRCLTLPEQQRMRAYALPPPPADLARNYFPFNQINAARKAKRK